MDLSLVSIQELLEELNKRTDANIFVYIQTRNKNIEEAHYSFQGGKFNCIGLTEYMKQILMSLCRRGVNI